MSKAALGPTLRIGLLTWSYPPEKSGLSHAAREIAEGLAQAGHDVRVLTMDRPTTERSGGVEIVGCAPDPSSLWARLRGIGAIGHLFVCARFAEIVRRQQKRRAFDVIEATNWYAPGLLVSLWPGRRAVFVTRHSTPAAQSARAAVTLRDRLDLAVVRTIERLSARFADGMISNTVAHGERVSALYGVSPPGPCHGVVGLSLPDRFVAAGAASRLPDALPVELLFVGRAEKRKGFDALCAALDLLAAEAAAGSIPDFHACVIGVRAADFGTIGTEATSRITALHRVPPDDLLGRFEKACVVVAPSRYESFGLVYQEAIAFGRPIVACAEDPSACVFVGETGAGLLAASCDGPAVADAIRRLLTDPDLRRSLHLAARQAAGRFTRPVLAGATEGLYREAAAARSNGSRRARSSSGLAAPGDISP